MRVVLKPILTYYTRRRTSGRGKLGHLRAPVILVANHVSHLDTPIILAALPRRFRKRTAVAAATDYFYRNRLIAIVVSVIFNTVPMDRKGGGLEKQAAILPLIGRIKIDVLDVELAPNSTPILVGRQAPDLGALAIPIPRRESACCACGR